MAALTLVLGGVRSGKSRWAEQRAAAQPPVTYLATAQAGDAEMARRIEEHRQRRARQLPPWQSVEEPWDVAAVVAAQSAVGCLLLEDVGLWVTNLLVGLPDHAPLADAAVRLEVHRLLTAIEAAPGLVIVVSQETGCGIMPANALARRFGDLLGEANQRLAALAEQVYLCVAGIPVPVKDDSGRPNRKDAGRGTREEG